ncbi:replication initiation and membrane attachment family protein [Metabacillus iocasae]|uniref:Replication initiation and membrane attachment protein n=1 Tax=Priestia iocasae TaxID=2291674 RepID=A0ABS2QR73_9BACI|nr:replication initiation and membrane attachment family protein [Metabacillus iocasae]MBM7701251.1 replication initiation and membrane attachment protein [Metabacillus iocasae]
MTEQHWKELIPVDRYVVRASAILQDYDRRILTMLYQPLIGSLSFSLYMTLWSSLNEDRLWGKEVTHHHLMAMMQMNLPQIHRERLKLEGIGLLKTYVKKQDEDRVFIYELVPPLTPRQFFNDGVLNVYLYNRLGKNVFQKIKQYFSEEAIHHEEFKDITRPFNEVYQSVHANELAINFQGEAKHDLIETQGYEYIDSSHETSFSISGDTFNFDLFHAGLSEAMISKKAITPKVKAAIQKLAFLYHIDPLQMKNIVISAVDEFDQVDIEQLRKAARDFYQFEHGDSLPSLSEKVQPPLLRTMENKQPTSQEEQLIKHLEVISPRQLLIEISGGAEPTKSDLQMIEDILFQQKLSPGVVNVLIHYVLLRTDMKLSKAYVEKIAGHWARKNIKTVQEAMKLAKSEHKDYQNWAENKQQKTTSKKIVRKEMVPDWLKQESEEQEVKKPAASQTFEEEKRKLKQELEQLDQDLKKKRQE